MMFAVESPITHTVGTCAAADVTVRAVAASATAVNAILKVIKLPETNSAAGLSAGWQAKACPTTGVVI